MDWLKKHLRLYTIGGFLVLVVGGLATLEGVWGLYSNEPLIPFLYYVYQANLPRYSDIIFLGIGFIVFGVGFYLLICIFKQTSHKVVTKPTIQEPKEIEEAPVFGIEVPEDKLHKVIGTPLPKGRTLDIKGKWTKRKIK